MAIKLSKKSTFTSEKHKYPQQNVKNKMQRKHPHHNIKFQIREEEPSKEQKKIEDNVIVAQEIKYVKLLASSDRRLRDKAFKSLRKWLTICSKRSLAFTEKDFTRLWKGLFYYMWMSDKPLVQEEVAESISNLVHCFHQNEMALLYTKCAFETLATEWFGIDQYRVDKFEMLVRRIVRQTFERCKRESWNNELISEVENIIENLLLDPKTVLGFSLHLTELYMEELAKVSCGQIPEETVIELVKPFVVHLTRMIDQRQINHVKQHIFTYLIMQSDVGLDYKEKFEAWKQAGFPGGNINAIQKFEISDDETEDEMKDENEKKIDNQVQSKPLDPRAGRVDVEIPQLPFNATALTNLFMEYRFHPTTTTKVRKQIVYLSKKFSDLSRGIMPIGLKKIKIPKKRKSTVVSKKGAFRLLKFEKELYSDSIKRSRKRKANNKIIETESENGIIDSLNEKDIVQNSVESELGNVTESDKYSSDTDNKNIRPQKKQKTAVKIQIQKSDRPANRNGINMPELEYTNNAKQEKERFTNKEKKISTKQNKRMEKKTKKLEHSKASLQTKSKIKSKRCTIEQTNVKCRSEIGNSNYVVNSVNLMKTKKTKRNSCGSWDISDSGNNSPSAWSQIVNEETNKENKNKKILHNDIKSINTPITDQTSLSTTWRTPVLKKLEKQEVRQLNSANFQTKSKLDSNSKKRVQIVLQKNTAQHTFEYIRQLRRSPEIPYDANRKPRAGVLKQSPLTNPINPFYKKS